MKLDACENMITIEKKYLSVFRILGWYYWKIELAIYVYILKKRYTMFEQFSSKEPEFDQKLQSLTLRIPETSKSKISDIPLYLCSLTCLRVSPHF